MGELGDVLVAAEPWAPFLTTVAVAFAGWAIWLNVSYSMGLTPLGRQTPEHPRQRDYWWKRFRFALDLALRDDPAAREVGRMLLEHQAATMEATPDDARLLEDVLVMTREREFG